MNSLWSDSEAEAFPGDLGQRIYTSRLLGREKSLVLHGGGNTSVKVTEKNLLGEDETRLYVKGSGWDLEHIEAAGFSPVRIDRLLKLAKLKQLSDPQMVNELRTQMTLASAPTPSVEAILHAILPYQYVDHTHADAVITITNTADGLTRIREIYGDNVVIVPYVMPGFDLARRCAEQFATDVRKNTIGMVLMNHGIFSFGKTAQESYERMIDLVTWAENYLAKQKAWVLPESSEKPQAKPLRRELAALRRDLSVTAGFPVILAAHDDPASLAFARRDDVAIISQQGPATPDHVIRTKRVPMIGRDSKAYAKAYKKYFDENLPKSTEPKTMLDPSPRVILDREFGVATAGRSAKDAAIVFDIYAHTMEILQRATLLGGYKALPAKDIFDVEYWDLEQAKLKGAGKPPFAGEIALVTGAASGIGKACVDSLLARGAAVVGLDINASISSLYNRPDYLGLVCDVTDEKQLAEALEKTARTFGGLDMLILNAGMFPPGCRIDALGTAEWGKVMRLNLDANLMLMREAHPLLKLAPNGGCVVVIGSKNVPAPGPGAAAYSASKAALNQLARVAALEWGADNIRINSLHPNAVFDTGIWTEEVLQTRAKHYGLTVEEYKRRNVLKTEVTSRDVAELAAEMCGPLFAKTTAAQVPVDGGNERVI
ncbi:MAG: bifunctional aldolase/short-chain dehydrogenase [Gammaproteobacteria bacterium]|nr:bifunctional aldolase/short-chain dehydrogenase [Gammaproteobacteria bacterium]MDH3407380.1 bifunctional aldolase/short-chain dehydrogenase [Gammaproteobacteria bacterium]